MTKYILIFAMVMSSMLMSSQTCIDSLTKYSFDCMGTKLKIHVPCDYIRTDYFQYMEGEILTIVYPDSSNIMILCGYDADISIRDNKSTELNYKKVVVKGYQLIYDSVPKNKVKFFDKAFDLLNEDI